MEKREISATLSEQALTFRPGGPAVSFDVTVINESDRFASFQLELIAPGSDRNLVPQWYTLSPEVSTKKPPGDRTQFKVVITNAPILGFIGTMNLTVRIFSSELRDERKYLLRLVIEQGIGSTLLRVDLPVRQFQTYPCNTVEIPVRVRNLSQQSADVVLRFLGLESSWLVSGAERRVQIDPGTQAEVTFSCQPPVATQAPSQDYPFAIEAIPQDGTRTRVEGSLDVLPIGFVQFRATPQKQRIPAQGGWWPSTQADPVTYELLFKNASNVAQQVNVQIQGKDQARCTNQVIPLEANLSLGETTHVMLEARKSRPWVGFSQTLRLEAAAFLSDQRLGSVDPATQSLELKVFPIIPLWLQAALIALLAALIAFWPRPRPEGHTDFVNSVRFSGDVLSVLSGSDDRTIRRWTVEGDSLQPKGKGILATTDKSVRVLRFVPENNDQVAAGLENGAVQLWNVPEAKQTGAFTYRQGDRIFDLVFTKDSHSLFSGHGSGLVLWWDRKSDTTKSTKPKRIFKLNKDLDYTVQALALSPDDRTLVSAGRYNRLVLWNLANPNTRPQRIVVPGGQNDLIWSVAFAAKVPNLLAMSDSSGYVTLWDLSQCKPTDTSPSQPDLPVDIECAVRDQWQGHGGVSIRAIALSPDGRLLVSAGDDGRVVLWPLTSQGKRDPKAVEGKEIDRHSAKVNSVDIARDQQGILVVSAGDDKQVTLRRVAEEP